MPEPTDPRSPSERPLLRDLVGDDDAFLAECWERDRFLDPGTPDRADRFAALLSADDLIELVAVRGLRHPFFRLIRDGGALDRSSYLRSAGVGHTTVHDLGDPGRITEQVWDGASLVGQGLQRLWPPLTRYCHDLADELGHRVQANAYLSPPGAQGFDLHHDSHDVFVLQVEGHKHWTVHAPAELLPHRRPSRAPGTAPPAHGDEIWSGELRPGDCLYLPRGFGHSARTSTSRSLHLTIGVLATTWRTVLRALADLLPDDDVELRRALPPGALSGDEAAFRDAWLDFGDRLAKSLAATDPEVVLERLRRDLWAGHPGVDGTVLARAFTADQPEVGTAVVVRPGAVEHLDIDLDHTIDTDVDGPVGAHDVAPLLAGPPRRAPGAHLLLRDRTITLPPAAADLVRALLDGEVVRAQDGPGDLDPESALVVIRRLYREGVVDIAASADDT